MITDDMLIKMGAGPGTVKLDKYSNEMIAWCKSVGLEFEEDYTVITTDEGIPPSYLHDNSRFHYFFFKEPEYATLFRLKWGQHCVRIQ